MNIQEKIAGKGFLDALVDEALILTKNYADTLNVKKPKGGRLAWNPSGTVRVFDTRLNQLIPLVGIKIQARRWFTYYTVTTDQNGFYQSPWGFDRPANYSLWFETGAFDVRSGTFGQAWIDGPKIDFPWDVDLMNGVDRFYAHVFRAAFRYHFGNIGGLTRPFWGYPMKYGAFDHEGSAQGVNAGNWTVFGLNPNIWIYRFSAGNELDSDEVFTTTCHETAHSTHLIIMNAGVIQYLQVSDQIVESWAVAVEWYITQLEYRERGIPNYSDENYVAEPNFYLPREEAYQYWRSGVSDGVYTSLFIDIVDNFNQRPGSPPGSIPLRVNDLVTGYTLAGIEQGFLKHVYGLGSLSNELKAHKPDGVENWQIDNLIYCFWLW